MKPTSRMRHPQVNRPFEGVPSCWAPGSTVRRQSVGGHGGPSACPCQGSHPIPDAHHQPISKAVTAVQQWIGQLLPEGVATCQS